MICLEESHLPEFCPGRGRCHGCLTWCDRCGDDVRTTCQLATCDAHHCVACGRLLTTEDFYDEVNEDNHRKRCFSCHRQAAEEEVEAEMLKWARLADGATDPGFITYCEVQVEINAEELKRLTGRT